MNLKVCIKSYYWKDLSPFSGSKSIFQLPYIKCHHTKVRVWLDLLDLTLLMVFCSAPILDLLSFVLRVEFLFHRIQTWLLSTHLEDGPVLLYSLYFICLIYLISVTQLVVTNYKHDFICLMYLTSVTQLVVTTYKHDEMCRK